MRLRQEVQALLRSSLITRQRRLPSALTDHTEVAFAVRIIAGINRRLVHQTPQRALAQHQVELPCARVGILTSENIRKRPREHGFRGHKRSRTGRIV